MIWLPGYKPPILPRPTLGQKIMPCPSTFADPIPKKDIKDLVILAMMLQETLETIWACKLRKENLDALYTKLGRGGGCLNGIDCFCKINM